MKNKPLPALILLAASGFALANSEAAMPFGMDREVYLQLGKVVLERIYPIDAVPDWGKVVVASAIDGHGRRFVYVGFDLAKTPGASVVFEVCANSKWPGLVMTGMVDSVAEFLTIQDNELADYPYACNESRRED